MSGGAVVENFPEIPGDQFFGCVPKGLRASWNGTSGQPSVKHAADLYGRFVNTTALIAMFPVRRWFGTMAVRVDVIELPWTPDSGSIS
jgi:hypothetical protein